MKQRHHDLETLRSWQRENSRQVRPTEVYRPRAAPSLRHDAQPAPPAEEANRAGGKLD